VQSGEARLREALKPMIVLRLVGGDLQPAYRDSEMISPEATEGHSIVNSFRYSVVIYSAAIPGYILGRYVVEWLDRKYAIVLSFASVASFGTLFGHSRLPTEIMIFGGLTVFFLSLGSTAIYTYTPELYPTEIRATAMGIASAWGRVGAVTMLLVFGHLFAIHGKSLLFLIIDPILG
jgi:MFS transporter, putative metabolite:H+ symporter